MKQLQADRAPGHPVLEKFLVQARRRFLYTAFLRYCLWAVLANEALRWGTVGLNLAFSLRLPVFPVGLYVFGLLMVRAVAGSRRTAGVARMMDHRLSLKNRLASYLDFRGRDDVPALFRDAQAEEAGEFLSRRKAAEAFRVGPLFKVAPVLLLAMVAFDFFNPRMPGPLLFRTIIRIPQPQSPDSRALSMEDDEPGAPVVREEIVPGEKDSADADAEDPRLEDPDVPGEEPAAAARREDHAEERGEGRTDSAGRPAGVEEQITRAGGGPWEDEEPVRLYSQTIGHALTPVATKTGTALQDEGRTVPPPGVVLQGRVAFDLAPRGMEAGPEGVGEGGRESGLRLVVDFDGIPAGYRVCVRRYFDGLGAETE